jgi:hypothetical protein
MHFSFVSLVVISLVFCLFHVIDSFDSYTNFFHVQQTQLDLKVSLFCSFKWRKDVTASRQDVMQAIGQVA